MNDPIPGKAADQVYHYIAKSWVEDNVKISIETMSKGPPKILVEIKGTDEKAVAQRVSNILAVMQKNLGTIPSEA